MKQKYIKNVATLKLDIEKCVGCGLCVTVCPHNVFAIENKKAIIVNKDNCIECGGCMNNCEPKAISVSQGVGWVMAVVKGILTGSGKNSNCC